MAIQLTDQELNKFFATQIKDQLISAAKTIQERLQQRRGISDCFDEETKNAVNSFVIDFAGSIIVKQ